MLSPSINPLMHHFLGITQKPVQEPPPSPIAPHVLASPVMGGFGGPVFTPHATPAPIGRPLRAMPPLGPQRSIIR